MLRLHAFAPAHRPDRLQTQRAPPMNIVKLLGALLIAAGVLGLVYGGFSFTKETHDLKLGPIELAVKEKESVNIPSWAGIGAIALGAALLLFGGKKR
jgi:hypothetical protein